jgi:integrase
MARGFAQWLSARDPRTEVPPLGLIPAPGPRRRPPHIYKPGQIAALLAAAGRLPSAYGLRARTWQTLYGLIAVTGMRLNEALQLEVRDVDLDRGLLHVRRSKNGGDRVLPLHADTSERLWSYTAERDRILVGLHDAVAMPETRVFLGEDKAPAAECGARYNFAAISRSIGLRGPQRFHRHGHGPRIHDLRHTFAVRTILGWFREGRDVDREMSKLSSYLGHASPEGSYWYIEAVPELMELAAARAERRWQEVAR